MGKVNVTIMDATGNRQQEAALPDDAPVGRIIAKLVQMMKLPTTGPTVNLLATSSTTKPQESSY